MTSLLRGRHRLVSLLLLAAAAVWWIAFGEKQKHGPSSAAITRPANAAQPSQHGTSPLDVSALTQRVKATSSHDPFSVTPLQEAPQVIPVSPPAPVLADHETKPSKPEAPALPFRYLGRFIEDGKQKVFLSNGEADYSVAVADRIGDIYEVAQITDYEVVLKYLPLNATQSLVLQSH